MFDEERGYLVVEVVPDGTMIDIGSEIVCMDDPNMYLHGKKTNRVLINQSGLEYLYAMRARSTVH